MSSEVWIAIIGGVFLTISGLIAWLSTRGQSKTDAKQKLDARIDQRVEKQLEDAWAKIDKQDLEIRELRTASEAHQEALREVRELDEKKMGAVGNIFRAIASQWPNDIGPDIDPRDIATLEDTAPGALPAHWIRRKMGGHTAQTRPPPSG